MLALLVGRALRRNELSEFELKTIQQREGRWVLTDLEGEGRRICDYLIRILAGDGKVLLVVDSICPGRGNRRKFPFDLNISYDG
jgi:hypothetical protein